MQFKDISYLHLWWPFLFSGVEPFVQFDKEHYEFVPVAQEMPFKDISYLEFWQPLCPPVWNQLCKYARGPYEKHFCDLDQCFKRKCHLRILLI